MNAELKVKLLQDSPISNLKQRVIRIHTGSKHVLQSEHKTVATCIVSVSAHIRQLHHYC